MTSLKLARPLFLVLACAFLSLSTSHAADRGRVRTVSMKSATRGHGHALPTVQIVMAASPECGLSDVPVDLSAVVFDFHGRQVERVPAGSVAADQGVLTLTWDGKRDGIPATPGVYRVRVDAPSLSLRTERLLVVR